MNQITLRNGWLVNIEETEKGYTIKSIKAHFGHGIYHPIDTSNFDDALWHFYHEAIRMTGYKI